MLEEIKKYVWAVALGGLIGGAVALDLVGRLSTWGKPVLVFIGAAIVGALVGGIISWISVDFKQLRSDWHRSWEVSREKIMKVYDWKSNKPFWEALFWMVIGSLIAFCSLALFIRLSGDTTCIVVGSVILSAFVSDGIIGCATNGKDGASLADIKERGKEYALLWNPITLPFLAAYELLLGFCLFVDLLRFMPKVFEMCGVARKEIGQFFVRAFKYAHNEDRRACAFYGAISAVFGLFAGYATVGALVGIGLGLASRRCVIWWSSVPLSTK